MQEGAICAGVCTMSPICTCAKAIINPHGWLPRVHVELPQIHVSIKPIRVGP